MRERAAASEGRVQESKHEYTLQICRKFRLLRSIVQLGELRERVSFVREVQVELT